MPFEPAPKESPAARLAALIELGRTMNPDLRFNGLTYYTGTCACALAFAVLGSGEPRCEELISTILDKTRALPFPAGLLARVEGMAFNYSLDEICLSLREGELAKVTA